MSTTNYDWAKAVLTDAGLPTTQNNINNVARWMTHENGASNWFNRNNPLNASLGTSAADGTASYPDLTTAASYTAKMIRQTNMGTIYKALAANAATPDFSTAVCQSPWAESHYGVAACGAGKYTVAGRLSTFMADGSAPPVVNASGTTTASAPAGSSAATGSVTPGATASNAFATSYPPIAAPPAGFTSSIDTGQIIVNGSTADLLVGDALITAQIDLSISQASTLSLTLHDPDAKLIQLPEFSQTSLLNFGEYSFQLVSVEKEQSVLTVAFESWAVAALRQATGAFTVAPGTMTRTDFASLLATQSVEGIGFLQADPNYLYGLAEGYAHTNLEQLSRGTIDAPLEDSWTCLQRLASEIQWVCFESFNQIYFGPYSYLVYLAPVLAPVQFQDGIETIDGTYDVGQPLGDLTITAVAGNWTPTIGQCIEINNLGPFNGNWLVSEMSRVDLTQPDITITCMQPLPGLPEPSTGGSQAAVGAGFVGTQQSPGGKTAAQKAVAYCESKLGDAYVNGADGPSSFDCSGLVMAAYSSVGVSMPRTTQAQWPSAAGTAVPAGVQYLVNGDLLYFGPSVKGQATHVGIVDSTNAASNDVVMISATTPSRGVVKDTITPTVGAAYGSTEVYIGALRPAP